MQNCGHLQLCENRRGEGVPTGFAEDPPDPTLQQRRDVVKKRNAEIVELNKMSTMVKDEIYANLWATMYWEYLIGRLFIRDPVLIEFSQTESSPPSESTTGASNSSTQRPLPQGYYNNKVEEAFLIEVAYGLQRDVLQRRYLDACEIARPIWEGMGRTIKRLVEGESRISDALARKRAGCLKVQQTFLAIHPMTKLLSEHSIKTAKPSFSKVRATYAAETGTTSTSARHSTGKRPLTI